MINLDNLIILCFHVLYKCIILENLTSHPFLSFPSIYVSTLLLSNIASSPKIIANTSPLIILLILFASSRT